MWWTLDAEIVIVLSVRVGNVRVVVVVVVWMLVRDWRVRRPVCFWFWQLIRYCSVHNVQSGLTVACAHVVHQL